MATNPATQIARRRRLRVVEELMLEGHKPQTIHDLVGQQFDVAYGTIRNDCVIVRKAHEEAIDKATELVGRREYLAKTMLLRQKASRAQNIELTHRLDKELARIHGVIFKEDTNRIHLSVEMARREMDSVMEAVFSVVTDAATQELIIKAIEARATQNLQIATAE